jgi:hypothetical protein
MMGRKESKAQKAMLAKQALLMEEQATGLRRQREVGDEMYSRYQDRFMPIEDQLADISQTIATPDYAGVLRRATGDYTRSRNNARAETQRSYARMGVDPSNPMYGRGINRTSIADALAMTTARNMAREAERTRTQNLGFDARMSVANLGRGLASGATSMMSSATSGFGSQAQQYGSIADMHGRQASSSYGAAGYFADSFARNLPEINWGGGNRGSQMSPRPDPNPELQ